MIRDNSILIVPKRFRKKMPESLLVLENSPDGPDRAFVVFASPEVRCCGVAQRMKDYRASRIIILRISDEPNASREELIADLKTLFNNVGSVHVVDTHHDDPLVGLSELGSLLRTSSGNGKVVVDVSTFPKNSLLLTLRTIEQIHGIRSVRIVYTEAEKYKLRPPGTDLFGLRRIGIIPTYGASIQPDEELLLIMLLGYERDRAVAMWQGVQPHRTIVAISKPSFRPEWDGVAERVNAPLLAAIGEESIHFVDPRDPLATVQFLNEVVAKTAAKKLENYYVAPLGTKPQTVGVYLFCRDNPDIASVIYGAPVAREHEYLSEGIGPSWTLAEWETING